MFHEVKPRWDVLPFLRALAKRPDLARAVRSFSNEVSTQSRVAEGDFELFEQLADHFHLHEVEKFMERMRTDKEERELWILEFTLALCSQATALFIMIPTYSTEYESVLGKLFMNSVTMSSVKRLFL
jgi:hypothetical protein